MLTSSLFVCPLIPEDLNCYIANGTVSSIHSNSSITDSATPPPLSRKTSFTQRKHSF